MITPMRAIDFNVWMSMIKYVGDYISDPTTTNYGINITKDHIKPSYPRDLSNFRKPSIIIHKVGGERSSLCFGRFIGQYFDTDDSTYKDIDGVSHNITFQIDAIGDNNTQCSLLTSLISENIMGSSHIVEIYDYIDDINNPVLMGKCVIDNDIEVTDLTNDNSKDYRSAIRFDINIIHATIRNDEYIDLSKWMKIINKIKF